MRGAQLKKPKGKVVSSTELSTLFGLQYGTVQDWIQNGMPYVAKPENPGERGWQFALGDVLAWRCEEARKEVRVLAAGTRLNDYDLAKARKMDADAQRSELELALKTGRAVLIDSVIEAVAKHVAACKAKLLAVPVNLSPLLAVETTAAACQRLVEQSVREALEELHGHGFDPAELKPVSDEPGSVGELQEGIPAAGYPPMGSPSEADNLAMG